MPHNNVIAFPAIPTADSVIAAVDSVPAEQLLSLAIGTLGILRQFRGAPGRDRPNRNALRTAARCLERMIELNEA